MFASWDENRAKKVQQMMVSKRRMKRQLNHQHWLYSHTFSHWPELLVLNQDTPSKLIELVAICKSCYTTYKRENIYTMLVTAHSSHLIHIHSQQQEEGRTMQQHPHSRMAPSTQPSMIISILCHAPPHKVSSVWRVAILGILQLIYFGQQASLLLWRWPPE